MWKVKREAPYRIGLGFDAHELKRGRPLLLGGVNIPYNKGLFGHSDGDVLLHAIMDAILGALALPDIGTLFPDTNPEYKGIASKELLNRVMNMVNQRKWQVFQVDCVLVCDQPKLSNHIYSIRQSIAKLLKIPQERVGLKAKTTEGTQLALPLQSVAVMAIALLIPIKG